MAKQDLINKIRSDAEEKAASLRADAKTRADALLQAAEEEAAALSESARKLARSKAPDLLARRRSMAELEVRKRMLSAKQEAIGKAYDEALASILSSKKYPALLAAMIASAAENGDRVLFSKNDLSRLNVRSIAGEAEKKLGFSLPVEKEGGDFRGGIVLLGKSYDKNLTLETELARLRAENGAVVSALFD